MDYRRRPSPILVVLGLLFSCSNGGDDGGGIPLASYGSRMMDANCALMVRCGFYPNQEACEAVGAPAPMSVVIPMVNAGKIRYDPIAAVACLDEVNARDCSVEAFLVPTGPSQTCQGAFTGTLSDGAECVLDEECVSKLCSSSIAHACSGTCINLTPVALGESCASPYTVCTDGYCNSQSVCVAKAGPGEACASTEGCVAGLSCLASTTGVAVCQAMVPRPAEGEVCNPTSSSCYGINDYCDASSGTCVPMVASGGSCADGEMCAWYAVCDSQTLTCVSEILPGQVCVADQSPGCMGYGHMTCLNGKCAVAPASIVCP
jgi:hypothetical protein